MDDRESFTAFVHESSRSLQRTAWLLTGDWASAEDLVQTALIKTWSRWTRVDHAAARGYVRRVMLRSYLGSRKRRWTGELALGFVPEVSAERDDDARLTLLAAVRKLPRQQRAVIALRYFEDLTEADTAAALGCSIGTVKSHASRAVAALRTSLVDERLT